MNRSIVIVLLMLSSYGFSQSKDEQAVRHVLDEQTKAWNQGDIDGFMKGYWKNDSLKFVGKSGITYGWNNTLTNYKKNYSDTVKMGKLDFNIISVKQLSPEYVFVTGQWHLKRSIGDVGGYFTLLFQKFGNSWLIITDHTS